MKIRFAGTAALVAAILLATGASSQAAYTLTTSISNVTSNGGAVVTSIVTPGMVISGPGFSATALFGGVSFLTAGGSTVYLLNDAQSDTSPPGVAGVASTNVQIFVNRNDSDSSNFNFNTNIAVNGSAAFVMTLGTNPLGGSGYKLANSSVVAPSNTQVFITPITYSTPLVTVTNISANAVTGSSNSNSNAAVGATFVGISVPEPASVAMLGLGMISLGGFALRRRMAK